MPSIFGAPKTSTGKTLQSLRERLVFEFGNRTDVPNTRWHEYINDAYRELCESLDIEELKDSYQFATTASLELYTLPDGLFTIRGVAVQTGGSLSEGYALIPMDRDYYRKAYARTAAPERYFRDDRVLVLWPTPDASYELSVDITFVPQDLTLDTDSPVLDVGKHEALFYLAKKKAAEGLQLTEVAQTAGNTAAGLLNRKRNPSAVESKSMPGGFRPIYSERDLIRRNGGSDGVR